MQQEEGAGIGLYLAREILQKEKGYIKLTSKVGEGVVLVFIFRGEYKEKLLRDNRNKKILQNCSFLERM